MVNGWRALYGEMFFILAFSLVWVTLLITGWSFLEVRYLIVPNGEILLRFIWPTFLSKSGAIRTPLVSFLVLSISWFVAWTEMFVLFCFLSFCFCMFSLFMSWVILARSFATLYMYLLAVFSFVTSDLKRLLMNILFVRLWMSASEYSDQVDCFPCALF